MSNRYDRLSEFVAHIEQQFTELGLSLTRLDSTELEWVYKDTQGNSRIAIRVVFWANIDSKPVYQIDTYTVDGEVDVYWQHIDRLESALLILIKQISEVTRSN